MAVGKNKSIQKKGKGLKKKIVDPFSRKDWYDVKVPSVISTAIAGKTLVNRTIGTKLSSDSLLGRVFEFNLADLRKDYESFSYRKIKFYTHEVQGANLLTGFHGMSITSDKHRFLVRKWQTLIDASTDVKTTDGYHLRVFAMAFTARKPNHTKKTCYAKTSEVKAIRRIMIDTIHTEISATDIQHALEKFITEFISKDIEDKISKIHPVQNVIIRKVKVIKKPKMDYARVLSFYENPASIESTTVTGTKVVRPSPVSEFIEPTPSDSI